QEFMQIDTTDILFVCGGAFNGLDKIIQSRIGRKGIGFAADIKSRSEVDIGGILKHVLPQDLLKYGLIPEFVGRVPVIATLDQLDKEALIRILTEPRNALVKQYQKLFELDGVTLEFAEQSLESIAEEAIKRDTGARGLRAILEENLIEAMFDLPSKDNIEKCMITREVIINKDKPILVTAKKSKKKEESA
ncbi:MAG: AAA domain-containing protein, partial [Firmicutes bacterium]|nr:AAA domain-containing protein [Bacillota bacterium]